jgi:hypothetical protein
MDFLRASLLGADKVVAIEFFAECDIIYNLFQITSFSAEVIVFQSNSEPEHRSTAKRR